jgi:hypothetical protein
MLQNKFIAQKLKGRKTNRIWVKKCESDKESQDMLICESVPIVCYKTNHKLDIYNGEDFNVISLSKDKKIVKITDSYLFDKYTQIKNISNKKKFLEEHAKSIKEFDIKDMEKYFRVAFAITAHKAQGCTFSKPYSIHQWNLMNTRSKYVSISRATQKSNINFCL